MPIITGLDLPLDKTVIDGPIVRAHRERKEENNDRPMTAQRLSASYYAVKDKNLDALRTLSEQSADS